MTAKVLDYVSLPFWAVLLFDSAPQGTGCLQCGAGKLLPISCNLLFTREELEAYQERFCQKNTTAKAVLFLEWRAKPQEGLYVIAPTFPTSWSARPHQACPHFGEFWPRLLRKVYRMLPSQG